jgi:tripartite ATP-independent transporter DctP family solute receptor
MRHLLGWFMTLAILAWTAGGAMAADKIVLKVGHDSPTSHPYQAAWVKFKEIVESETKGAVEVQIFPDAQIGDEPKLLEGIRLGTVDGAGISSLNLAQVVPELQLFSLPFLFRDVTHLYRVEDGPIGKQLSKAIEGKTGTMVLGWAHVGVRVIWNSKRPVLKPADLKGIKMRTMSNPIILDSFTAFGAQATTIPFAELYTALQQGVVDGADNDVVDILTSKFYEVTKHVSWTNHTILGTTFLFSKRRYDRLSPEVQKAVLKGGEQLGPTMRKGMDSLAEDATKQLKAKGLQFHEVDTKPFKELVTPVYKKYADRVGGMKMIEDVGRQ